MNVIISDNGPPFNGIDYKRYLETLGITPINSLPRYSPKVMRKRSVL